MATVESIAGEGRHNNNNDNHIPNDNAITAKINMTKMIPVQKFKKNDDQYYADGKVQADLNKNQSQNQSYGRKIYLIAASAAILILYSAIVSSIALGLAVYISRSVSSNSCDCTLSSLAAKTDLVDFKNSGLCQIVDNCLKIKEHTKPPTTTLDPTQIPSSPTKNPINNPSQSSTNNPSQSPTNNPPQSSTKLPSQSPTEYPTKMPSVTSYQHYIGDFKISAQPSTHDKWLLCDGSYLNPTNYPKLFNAIGYTFGKSSSLFALPDATDRVIGIVGSSNAQGAVNGNENIELSNDNMPSHFHYLSTKRNIAYQGNTYKPWEYSYPYLAWSVDYSSSYGYQLTADNYDWAYPSVFESSSVGNGTSFSVLQPTVYVGNLFIYAD